MKTLKFETLFSTLIIGILFLQSCEKNSLEKFYIPILNWGITPNEVIGLEDRGNLTNHILKENIKSGGCGGDVLFYELQDADDDSQFMKSIGYFFDENNQLVAVYINLFDNEETVNYALNNLKEAFGMQYEKNESIFDESYWYTWHLDSNTEIDLTVDYDDIFFGGVKINYEKDDEFLVSYEFIITK